MPRILKQCRLFLGTSQAISGRMLKSLKSWSVTKRQDEQLPEASSVMFNQATADAICARLAEGEPLRQICRDAAMPAWRTVYDWIEAQPEFAARIACAREAGFDAIAEECLSIADDTSKDTMIVGSDDNSREAANTEWISRSKLRVETRLKLLAKWSPKRYGDKIELGGQLDVNSKIERITRRIVDGTGT